MPKSFTARFTNLQSQQETVVSAEIPDAEWKMLLRYVREAEQLAKLLRGGMEVNFNFLWNDENGASFKTVLPSEITIAAFLHRMRPFVLVKKENYFKKACNILSRYVKHPQVPDITQKPRERFSEKDFQSLVKIEVNGAVLNSDEMLGKWLNAFEYHRDTEKQEELNALYEAFPLESAQAVFLLMMIGKAEAICEIGKIVLALDKRLETPLTIQVVNSTK